MLAGPHRPMNRAVTSRSTHDRLDDPRPLYPVGEDIYREPEPDTRPSPAPRLGEVSGRRRR
jgi:hypothetical protein